MKPAVGADSKVSAGFAELNSRDWRYAAIAMLSVRFIQGFIYWGGGSRRFIYGPEKLDPGRPTWMANKLQSAMPGALMGLDHVVAYMLQHFWLLYAGLIAVSALELVAGAMLMAGLLTRLAALASIGLSIALMLLFGWQGATCIDEWTMAAANLAMGATLWLAGSGAYSLDNVMLRRWPGLASRSWFRWSAGSLRLPVSDGAFRNLGLMTLAFVLAFDLGTYSYYRGSVVTPFHGGPVSPTKHHLTISQVSVSGDGSVRFHVYLDAGTPEAPAHVMKAELLAPDGRTLATWDTEALTALPATAIRNDFGYNRFKAGPYGLAASMGAKAWVTLPPPADALGAAGASKLRLTDVNGRAFIGEIRR
jgi:thiosulfate dehydrogenase [quinone] large subunit